MPADKDLPTWDQGRLIESGDLNTLSGAVRELTQRFADNCPESVGQAYDSPGFDYFLAIVQDVSTDGQTCTIKRAKPDESLEWEDPLDATEETYPGIKTETAFAATNLACLPDGGAMPSADTPLLVFRFSTRGVDGATAVDVYVFWWSVGGLIPVTVSQSGGANGNSTTAPTYTYTATNAITGVAYTGGPFSVSWARPKGLVTAATHGTAFYDADGNFVLWQVDEKPGGTACT
jgi:hypothetical protein